ncbi:MAG: hypothetical protein E7646_07040 [Ruminococcaceae bacterium]|nr:hypothetical protein [Oscillospiraceae bacterium]
MLTVAKAGKVLIAMAMSLALILPYTVYAKSYELPISPAIEIIRNRTKLKKEGIKNQELQFTKTDFTNLLGEHTDHVTILTLPENGSLSFMGAAIEKGATISVHDLERLSYVPDNTPSKSICFSFKNSVLSDKSSLECVIEIKSEDK